jgi:hypothetical protein
MCPCFNELSHILGLGLSVFNTSSCHILNFCSRPIVYAPDGGTFDPCARCYKGRFQLCESPKLFVNYNSVIQVVLVSNALKYEWVELEFLCINTHTAAAPVRAVRISAVATWPILHRCIRVVGALAERGAVGNGHAWSERRGRRSHVRMRGIGIRPTAEVGVWFSVDWWHWRQRDTLELTS